MTHDLLITRREILKNQICPSEYESNLLELLIKINKVRDAFGRPMLVTSGFRSMSQHLKIYADRGIKDTKKIPMKSRHLYCMAIDIADPNNELYEWCENNQKLIREIGLWIEKDQGGWVHFQIVPPLSGKLFFMP